MVLEGRIVGDEEVVPTVIDQRRPVVIASAISRRRQRDRVGTRTESSSVSRVSDTL